ncbi:hypothetical protein HYH03_010372 [Edaphochlamys debaryana]|uniref:U-box domain-containing protein n=1 Tax=Edaphochlamys debaryana TaxID=47281 RepID=A0A835Y2H9_9CHLO|nr:hypothetical protein HYH03_010372 [Edaphochlamys debaryana]|eukprot:KAG2491375.1 hypothetical protein HYH03_010372 [Edaphochlamys debaryana]
MDGDEAPVFRHGEPAMLARPRLAAPPKRVLVALAIAVVAFSSCWMTARQGPAVGDGVGADTLAPPGLDGGSMPAEPAVKSMKIAFTAWHPLNLVGRMAVQTVFGLPGETAGRIPLLYSNFELEVVLRPLSEGAQAGPAARDWTDPAAYIAQEPASAAMYAASLLTLPRATLLYAWWHEHEQGYSLFRSAGVRPLEALRMALRAARLLPRAPSPPAAACPAAEASTSTTPDTCPAAASAPAPAPAPAGLGAWLWPLTLVAPGLAAVLMALGLVGAAPVVGSWAVVTCLIRGVTEAYVLFHVARLLRQRRPQAAVQCLACSHGVPLMLGAHALCVLRILSAVLPARFFVLCCAGMYAAWVQLAVAAVMWLSLRPNNGQLLEGAVDGLLHLAQRNPLAAEGEAAGADALDTADAAAHQAHAHAGGGATALVSLKRRQHWPPPLTVAPHLHEIAPRHLLCPITHHVLSEPAVTSTGATYEREAIVAWLSKAGKDPLTGQAVSPHEVFPNLAMYTAVEEWLRDAPKAHEA